MMRVSKDRTMLVGDYVMLDALEYPPPRGVQLLCGSVRYGTTVKGYFDPKHHDCWLPMPQFPDSCKERYRAAITE